MHIEAELDDIHAERLTLLQARLQKPLAEVLATAIDAALVQLEPTAYRILEEEGLIGCMAGEGDLSVEYKKQLWETEQ